MQKINKELPIPTDILDYIAFIEQLLTRSGRYSEKLNVKISADIEAVHHLEFGGCASGFIIDTGKHFYKDTQDPVCMIHEVMGDIDTRATVVDLNCGLIKIEANVQVVRGEIKTFSSMYNVLNDKGMPYAIYEAYAYLCRESNLPKSELLEIFGTATCDLACRTFDECFIEEIEPLEFYFDAYDALMHDLKSISQK